MEAERFRTHSLHEARLLRILAATFEAVDPYRLVRNYLQTARLPAHRHLFLLGIGKAAEPMTLAAADSLGTFRAALIITKHASEHTRKRVTVIEGGHPIPDARSLNAGRAAWNFVHRLGKEDLLLCLISGGGSALASLPPEGIALADLQALTAALLACGAAIEEVNAVRRQFDSLKGGGLARATPGRVLSLILSDVPGDPLEAIASGPTAPNPTTRRHVREILRKYRLEPAASIRRALAAPQGRGRQRLEHVQNIVIGNNRTALRAACTQARAEGFRVELLRPPLRGEARRAGARLARKLRQALPSRPRPFCLIAGGETTVTLRGNGRGGRNQELALAAVEPLAGLPQVLLIALATDGQDGPTDAAGAVVSGETRQRAERLGMAAPDYLSRNDAYPFFNALHDLIKTGYSGTNVNDLTFLVAF